MHLYLRVDPIWRLATIPILHQCNQQLAFIHLIIEVSEQDASDLGNDCGLLFVLHSPTSTVLASHNICLVVEKNDNHPNLCLSQDLETGCLKLAVVKFLGVQIFKGDHNILIFQL